MSQYNPNITPYYASSGAAYPTNVHPNTAALAPSTSIPLDHCLQYQGAIEGHGSGGCGDTI